MALSMKHMKVWHKLTKTLRIDTKWQILVHQTINNFYYILLSKMEKWGMPNHYARSAKEKFIQKN